MWKTKFKNLNLFKYDAILTISDMQNTDSYNSLSFEINLFNLLGIVKNPKIIVVDDSSSILLKKDYKTDTYNIDEVKAKILQSIRDYN